MVFCDGVGFRTVRPFPPERMPSVFLRISMEQALFRSYTSNGVAPGSLNPISWSWRSRRRTFESLTRVRNERSRKSVVFVTGGRIGTRVLPRPPRSFRLSFSSQNSPTHHSLEGGLHMRNTALITTQSVFDTKQDTFIHTLTCRPPTRSHAKTRTNEPRSGRRSDARGKNPPTHCS